MTAERWQQIEQLYHDALECESNQRTAFLDKVCAGDDGLRREVEALLVANSQAGGFLDEHALAVEAKEIAAEQILTRIQIPAIQHFSHYQILSKIGAGGMGEVYLARDTRLERRVAIKILPLQFTADGDRLRRFVREAKAASALNHPNIITIYEIGEVETTTGKTHFIATEFIEGETLRRRMAEGVELREALNIAIQTASALDAAHQAGIVHRDIKPENIMVRPDGLVKVLDFGLAKLGTQKRTQQDETDTNAETVGSGLKTEPGMILGTLRYMSPEQARGRTVDGRSDVFSLGVVLYEMIARQSLFAGDNSADVIASIIHKEPDPLAKLVPSIPAELERIIHKALAKDCRDRYQTTRDLQIDLQTMKQEAELSARLGQRIQLGKQMKSERQSPSLLAAFRRKPQFWLTVALLPVMLVAGWWWQQTRHNEPASQSPTVWPVKTLINWRTSRDDDNVDYRFSPDGKVIAFFAVRSGHKQLILNQTGEDHPWQITNDEWDNSNPIWSPDGRFLAFVSNRSGQKAIWRIPAFGGNPTLLGNPRVTYFRLLRWLAGGTIYYEAGKQLFAIEAATGQIRTLISNESPSRGGSDFSIAPDGQRLVCIRNQDGQDDLWISHLDGSAPRRLTNDAAIDESPVWHPDGQQIFYTSLRNGVRQIFVLSLSDHPTRQLTFGQSDYWVADVVSSSDGVRILCRANRADSDLWCVNAVTGKEQPLTSDLNFELWPAVAPNGQALAFQNIPLRESTQNVSIDRSALVVHPTLYIESQPRQLAVAAYQHAWSPDGRQLAFLRFNGVTKTNLWVINAAGGEERQLTHESLYQSAQGLLPFLRAQPHDYDWTRDSSQIAYISNDQAQAQIRLATVNGEREPSLLYSAAAGERLDCPSWSPDGRQIAYASSPLTRSRSTTVRHGIWVASPTTGQPKLVYQSDFALRLLGWSESGQELWLAYNTGQFYLAMETEPVHILQFSLVQQQITKDYTLPAAYACNTFLSPNRRFIAFTAQEADQDSLWIMSLTGGVPRKLTEAQETRIYFSSLAWSPDSREIYYGKQTNWSLLAMIEQFK